MTKINITKPHGYLLDSENKVIIRFANWSTGQKQVPDAVASVEYVDRPNAHDRDVHEDYKKQP